MSRLESARWGVPVLLAILLCPVTAAWAQSPAFPFQDPALPVDKRVDDLVSRMTLEEKASQLVNRTRAIPRLNVPEYNIWSEALHGVAGGGFATVFPQAIGLGATFDAPTLHEMARRHGARGPRQVQPGRSRRDAPAA
jgi:beta-glucosidase